VLHRPSARYPTATLLEGRIEPTPVIGKPKIYLPLTAGVKAADAHYCLRCCSIGDTLSAQFLHPSRAQVRYNQPRSFRLAQDRGHVEQQETKISAGQRLLIVDDDPDLRMLLAGYFRRIGYEVEERESGMAAIEPAASGNFDCFILDVSMPGMTGIDLLRRVRDRGVKTPALFLTAHDTI